MISYFKLIVIIVAAIVVVVGLGLGLGIGLGLNSSSGSSSIYSSKYCLLQPSLVYQKVKKFDLRFFFLMFFGSEKLAMFNILSTRPDPTFP